MLTENSVNEFGANKSPKPRKQLHLSERFTSRTMRAPLDEVMKIALTLSLFLSAASGIRTWIGLPATEMRELDKNWLEDQAQECVSSARPARLTATRMADVWMNDDFSDDRIKESKHQMPEGGSGTNMNELYEALGRLVKALKKIIPALKKFQELRDQETKKYAQEFTNLLIHGASNDELRRTLGKHVRLMFTRCQMIQLAFLHAANYTGLFQLLNQAIDNKEVDSTEIMIEVVKAAENKDFGMFNRIEDLIRNKGLSKNPAMRAFGMMSKLLTSAACGENRNADGLLLRIGAIVHSKQPNVTVDLKQFLLPFVYQRLACKKGRSTMDKLPAGSPQENVKHRLLRLLFEPCKEVKIVQFGVQTTMQAVTFFKRMHLIGEMAKKENIELSKQVRLLLEIDEDDEADLLVGNKVLTDMRRGILVALAVQKLQNDKLKPE